MATAEQQAEQIMSNLEQQTSDQIMSRQPSTYEQAADQININLEQQAAKIWKSLPDEILENEEIKESEAKRAQAQSALNQKAADKKKDLKTEKKDDLETQATIRDESLLQETNQRLRAKIVDLIRALEIVTEERNQLISGVSSNTSDKKLEMQNGALKQLIIQRDTKIEQLNEQLLQKQKKKIISGSEIAEQLTNQLNLSKLKIEQLKSEIKSLKSVQIEMSKAIKQLTNENELPLKIKVLQEDVKQYRDKNQKLMGQIQQMEKNAKMQQQHMVKLEEYNRELIKQIKNKKQYNFEEDYFDDIIPKEVTVKMASISSEISITGSQAGELGQKVSNLQKEASLLSKRSQKDDKLLRVQKKMFDQHVQKQNLKIRLQDDLLREKDKEIRIQSQKIRDIILAKDRDKVINREIKTLSEPSKDLPVIRSNLNNYSRLNPETFQTIQDREKRSKSVQPQTIITDQPIMKLSPYKKSNFLLPIKEKKIISQLETPINEDLELKKAQFLLNPNNENLQIYQEAQAQNLERIRVQAMIPQKKKKKLKKNVAVLKYSEPVTTQSKGSKHYASLSQEKIKTVRIDEGEDVQNLNESIQYEKMANETGQTIKN